MKSLRSEHIEAMTTYYCDHAATTPCRADVWTMMGRFATEEFSNPSSFHRMGRQARRAVEQARQQIAMLLGASASEIVFTSGGSESINLALRGAALANRHLGSGIVTTAIEHEASLRSCEALRPEGFRTVYLAPDSQGRLSREQVRDAITEDTVLLSVIHANNELGTIQPLRKIVQAAREKKPSILIHADAVQSVGHIPVNVEDLGVDLLSFTAHKFYGPKGVGGLYVRQGTKVEAEILGGNQECGMRSGTESVPLLVGMAAALRAAISEMDTERSFWRAFRDEVAALTVKQVADCRINGKDAEQLDHFLHMSFRGVEGEDVVLALDDRGIYASAGSACNLSRGATSHVLHAIGLSRSWNRGSVRLTFGHACRTLSPEWLARCIAESVAELRSLSPVPLPRRRAQGQQTM
jgi:cysteine desulfurase